MNDIHFTFSSFFSNYGPHDNIAFDYDINADGMKDLILGSGARINYNGYIFSAGHMAGSPIYLTNKGGFEFDLRVNSFENKSINHSMIYNTVVDTGGDDFPEFLAFGEHYHISTHQPEYKLIREWLKSKNINYGVDYSDWDFKKIRYFKYVDGEIRDMSYKINDPNVNCFYNFYQTAYADLDNDGDIDFVAGAQLNGADGNFHGNDCNVWGYQLAILRNNGDGSFDLEWVGKEINKSGDFETSGGYMLLEDLNGDSYVDMIYNGSSGTGGGTRYMLNDGSGSFIFDLENRIDTPPQGIRNIYASDLNDDGNKEIIVFNSSGFGANGATGLPNIIKIYSYDHNLNFLDVTDQYFDDKDNEMDFYSNTVWVKYFDLDNDGFKDLVPRFELEPKDEPGNDYPNNAYYGDWNNSRGFQYFKFNKKSKKFEIIDLGVIDKIEAGNTNCSQTNSTYNLFDFYDLDGDGVDEWVRFGRLGPYDSESDFKCQKASIIIYKMVDLFDDDDDGVFNHVDQCPDTPAGVKVDVTGCQIFELPVNNFKVEVGSATCIGNSDGVIDLSVEDASYDYTVTITGKDNVTITGTNKTASVTGLAKGTYEVCFTVDGQANYEQCFEVVVGEPPALTAFIDIDNDKKRASIQMSGSNKYNVTINGIKQKVTGNSFEATLSTGLSIIRVDTDLECQGFVEREVFISEDIHYYPNPTDSDVKVHVGGEDTRVKVSIFSEKGDLIYSRYQDIADMSRKTNIDLTNQIPGAYIVVLESKTVRKTFKVIRE